MGPEDHFDSLLDSAGSQWLLGWQVKLCDAASGGFTHTLVGHREGVWAACWSPTSEWHLITGGCDGQVLVIKDNRQPTWRRMRMKLVSLMQVRYWDIRQSGCLHCFDQHDTHKCAIRPSWSCRISGSVKLTPSGYTCRRASETAADAGIPLSQSAVAHDGCVTAVNPTPDGLRWLTAGTDSRVRAWESDTFRYRCNAEYHTDAAIMACMEVVLLPFICKHRCALVDRNTLVNFPNSYNRSVKVSCLLLRWPWLC